MREYIKNKLKGYRVSNKVINEILDINDHEYLNGLILGVTKGQTVVSEALSQIAIARDFWDDEIPVEFLEDLTNTLQRIWK